MPEKKKKMDKFTMFVDYGASAEEVAAAAAKEGISKSAFIRNSLRKQLDEDPDSKLIINMNPRLKSAFNALAKMDTFAERFATAVVKGDTKLSERIDKEYTEHLIGRGVNPPIAGTVSNVYRKKCEELGLVFKEEFVKTAATLMVEMLKEEWAKETRLKKKEVTRGGI